MNDEKPMGQVIQIDEARIRDHLGEMVRGTVEETLNAMLDIRSRRRRLSNGRSVGGGRIGVGALAYLLKYGSTSARWSTVGKVNRGDHAPILDRPLFEAVQTKLAVQTVARRCQLRGSRRPSGRAPVSTIAAIA